MYRQDAKTPRFPTAHRVTVSPCHRVTLSPCHLVLPRRHEATKIPDTLWLSYRLSAIGYQLSAIGYQLSAISYRLSAIGYQLSAIGYQLSAIGYQLSAFGYRLHPLTQPSRSQVAEACTTNVSYATSLK